MEPNGKPLFTLPPEVQEYARQADYSVMVNRFKLLNLVQQLAHQDVMEMIDAVGLDALAYKGTIDKWPFAGRRSSGLRGSENDGEMEQQWFTDRRTASSGAGSQAKAGGRTGPHWAQSRKVGKANEPLTARRRVKGTVFRSEREREAYFHRLADPRSRKKVINGDVPEYPDLLEPSEEQEREQRSWDERGAPVRPHTGAAYRRSLDEEHQMGQAADTGSVDDPEGRPQPPAASSILNTGGKTLFHSRGGRGLAPKAKPMGVATDTTVPINVVRQAARMVMAGAAEGPSNAVQGTSGSAAAVAQEVAGEETEGKRQGGGGSDSAAPEGKREAPAASTATADPVPIPQNATEMMALVESMLQAQEQALHQVVSDIDLSGRPELQKTSDPQGVEVGTSTSPGRQGRKTAVDYLEDALWNDSDEEEMDELLVLDRMNRRLASMEGELASVGARQMDEAETSSPPPRQRRRRGAMPEAMRQRLLSARTEAFEYIAFNERQWNFSAVSQFTFAQRLMHALAEDGFNEVLEEVLTIMDDYVEGLADHELQGDTPRQKTAEKSLESMSDGRGFVHPNLPASIRYTKGHKVPLSAVKARKSRVETVQLPAWMDIWRRARKAFQADGYSPMATDAKAVSYLPDLAAATARTESFFCTAAPHAGSGGGAAASGITVVSHHKVTGACEFTYPDYDGVMLHGAVPEVIETEEDCRAAEERRALYISPLEMSEEELSALEELQMMWKSRSHRGVERVAAPQHIHEESTAEPMNSLDDWEEALLMVDEILRNA